MTPRPQLTSKSRDNRDKHSRLREEAPRLANHSHDCEKDGTSLRGHVPGENARKIHTCTDVVLCDIDKELMRPDSETSEESQGAAGGSVMVRLGELEDDERLPHGFAVLSPSSTGSQDPQERAKGDGQGHRQCRSPD